MKIYLNGRFYDSDKAMVSVYDHGFLYGYGVFETLRTYHKILFKAEEHIDRLFHSARLINLPIKETKKDLYEM